MTEAFSSRMVHAGSGAARGDLCLSCNACRAECRMQLATGRLQPLRLVRLANLGLWQELLTLPEVWYCLGCNQCIEACPASVTPSWIAQRARREALARGVVTPEQIAAYDALSARLQRVRWHATARCRQTCDTRDFEERWEEWSRTPVPGAPDSSHALELGRIDAGEAGPRACLTCRECTSACPIAWESSVFDPAAIFRRLGLGLERELLESPSLWLCLGCQRCTESCAQGVKGHQLLQNLQVLALHRGTVPPDFRERLGTAERAIYRRFLRELDELFGFCSAPGRRYG